MLAQRRGLAPTASVTESVWHLARGGATMDKWRRGRSAHPRRHQPLVQHRLLARVQEAHRRRRSCAAAGALPRLVPHLSSRAHRRRPRRPAGIECRASDRFPRERRRQRHGVQEVAPRCGCCVVAQRRPDLAVAEVCWEGGLVAGGVLVGVQQQRQDWTTAGAARRDEVGVEQVEAGEGRAGGGGAGGECREKADKKAGDGARREAVGGGGAGEGASCGVGEGAGEVWGPEAEVT